MIRKHKIQYDASTRRKQLDWINEVYASYHKLYKKHFYIQFPADESLHKIPGSIMSGKTFREK